MYPPFTPNHGAGVVISASTTSADEPITTLSNGGQIIVTNSGSVVVFVRWGSGTQTAVNTDVAIPGGDWRIFTVAPGTDTVAALTASSTATVYVSPGHGS